MQHIKPLRKSASAVHAVLTDEETWCGWYYLSREHYNGNHIPMAYTTDKPLSCGRCVARMRALIQHRMFKELTPSQVEAILELTTKQVLGS